MDEDNDPIRLLFSNTVTINVKETGDKLYFSGPSFLMAMVLGMQRNSAELSKKGCISFEDIRMFYVPYAAKDKPYHIVEGVYKSSQLKELPLNDILKALLKDKLPEDGNIPVIRDNFVKCEAPANFFYIPLTLVNASNPLTGIQHANGIIVSKSKGTYFRIEPQYSEEIAKISHSERIQTGIDKALNEIGAKSFSYEPLNMVCPQALTDDLNCLFWTAFLTLKIIDNLYRNKDPNDTIKQIMDSVKQDPSKLGEVIRGFRQSLWKYTTETLAKQGWEWEQYEMLKKENKIQGGMYWPLKYYRGLTRKQNLQRKRSATRRTKLSFKNPKAYVPFKSDKGVKTRKSSYTERFHKKYPDAKSLSEIAKATGISKSILQEVYDRGMAAWRTGHRPGASQHAWGMARVHSFVMKGKTWRTADADLARKV